MLIKAAEQDSHPQVQMAQDPPSGPGIETPTGGYLQNRDS